MTMRFRLSHYLIFMFIFISVQSARADFPLVGTLDLDYSTQYDQYTYIDGLGPRWIKAENIHEEGGNQTLLKLYKAGPGVGGSSLILDKTIAIPRQDIGGRNSIYYLSTHLFDTDDGIEFLLADGKARIRVYDEDGTLLLSKGENSPGNEALIIMPGAVSCNGGSCFLNIHVLQGSDDLLKRFVYRLPGSSLDVALIQSNQSSSTTSIASGGGKTQGVATNENVLSY